MNKAGLYKGLLEPVIMQLLRDNGRMYGYEITQKVKEMTKGELRITEGALYPLLHRLEADGIVEAEMESIGNRIRKYYSLTKAGKKEVTRNRVALRTFVKTMQLIIHPKNA